MFPKIQYDHSNGIAYIAFTDHKIEKSIESDSQFLPSVYLKFHLQILPAFLQDNIIAPDVFNPKIVQHIADMHNLTVDNCHAALRIS